MPQKKETERFHGVTKEQAAEFLKEKRSAKYTQAQFIKRVGMNHIQYLSQFENARMDWRRSAEYRTAIIKELGILKDELLQRAGIGNPEIISDAIELTEEQRIGIKDLEVYQARIDKGISPKIGTMVYISHLNHSSKEHLTAFQIDNNTKFSAVVKNGRLLNRDIIVVDNHAEVLEKSMVAAWDDDRQTLLVFYNNEHEHVVFYSVNNSKPPIIIKFKDLNPIGVVVWRGGAI